MSMSEQPEKPWVQKRLDESRDFSAGWNSALWEVAKEFMDEPPRGSTLMAFLHDLAHTPPQDRRTQKGRA